MMWRLVKLMTHDVKMNRKLAEASTGRRNSSFLFIHRFVESTFDFHARFRIPRNKNKFRGANGYSKIYYLFTILAHRSAVLIREMRATTEWWEEKCVKPLGLQFVFLFLSSRSRPKTWWFIWPISLYYLINGRQRTHTQLLPRQFQHTCSDQFLRSAAQRMGKKKRTIPMGIILFICHLWRRAPTKKVSRHFQQQRRKQFHSVQSELQILKWRVSNK